MARDSRFHCTLTVKGVTLATFSVLAVLPAWAQNPAPIPQGGFAIRSNADWVPYNYSLDIKRGSVFDFSALNHTPAGKFGRVITTSNGHFAFADRPDTPVRFWGVNLCFSSNFLEPKVADQLAVTLHRAGYNTVRLHHFDGELIKAGGPSYELDPEKLAQLDYLFARLKQQGLYLSIDLFCSRKFKQTEIPDLGRDFGREFKRLLPLSETAFDSWQKFSRNLLTHVNPHTGIAWGQDPALIGICPVNEDSTTTIPKDAGLQEMYDKALDAWMAQDPKRAQPDRMAASMRFLTELYERNDARMMSFLRHELKVNVPLTGANYRTGQMLSKLRAKYDYVDNHQYHDHPEFPNGSWVMPYKFIQQSAIRRGGRVPGAMMPTRIFGKPFTVTEYNYVWPNRFRAEGGLMMAAYSSLQDWDGIYNFDWASSDRKAVDVLRSNTFDISSDVINLLTDRLAAVAFLRRDIKPARNVVGYLVRDESIYAAGQTKERDYSLDYMRVGLTSRIGTYVEGNGRPPKLLITDAPRPGNAQTDGNPIVPIEKMAAELAARGIVPAQGEGPVRHRSDTGEIEMTPEAGTMKVAAPRFEGLVLPPGQELSGAQLTAKNGGEFGAVYLISVDNKDLSTSRRMLLLHLTDVMNDGVKFEDERRLLLTDLGALPHLVRRGSVDLTLKLDQAGGGNWQLWKVATDGTRLSPVPLTWTPEKQAQVRLETVGADGAALAYELVRE